MKNNIKKGSTQINTCCICGKKFTGYGNNPEPLKSSGVCCNECNSLAIEERIKQVIASWTN